VIVQFLEFRLDLDSGELYEGTDRVVVPDQPLRILTTLIRHSGTLVTRDELRRAVWHRATSGW
jgi:DNA-binding winged helix-turn-helix (wHTH) protein